MKAERQGMAGIHNRVNSRWHAETLMFVFAFLAVLFFASPAWSACQTGDYTISTSAQSAGGLSSVSGHYCCLTNCTLYYCPNQQLCSSSDFCKQNNFYNWQSFVGGYWYSGCDGCKTQQQQAVCNSGSLNYSGGITLHCSVRCNSECESKQNSCSQIEGAQWDAANCECIVPPPECKTKFCCDSLNQNLPVKTDTLWLGCVASDPSSDKCVVYSSNVTPGDTTLNAECNGKSRYQVCTEMWMWSESAKQCAPLPTTNCIEYDVQDSMCSNVICSQTQQHELSALDYNHLTQCYTGKETVRSILICSNGLREPGTEYVRDFKVCKPFLDSLGIGIDNYISGGSGASGYGWGGQSSGGGIGGGSGGSGGGEGGGGSGGGGYGGGSGGYGGDSDGNGMGDAYQGGPGVDAQGDSVYNSPSPGLGGTWTPIPTVVTETDSNGNVTIVKNSQGGDSITTQDVYTEIRCLGVHNGIATMTNGLNTWTCEASSCSQATLSASIYGGACSGQKNGVGTSETNPSLPTINGDDGFNLTRMAGDIQKMLASLERFNADVNANSIVERRKQDSIAQAQENMWKVTFGNDFSYISTIKDGVVNFGDGLSSLQSANSQGFSAVVDAIRSASSQQTNVNVNVDMSPVVNAVNSASSQNSVMLSHVLSAMQESVNSASSLNTASIENAVQSNANAVASAASANRDALYSVASANRDAIYSAASDIVASNDRIRIAVASNTSSVNDVKSAVNTQGQNIVDAINGLASASSNNGGIVDTVHRTNQILESIESAVVDTGKNIPASIWSLDSTVYNLPMRYDSMTRVSLEQWSNDKLVMIVDSNVKKVTDAIDCLHVDVKLDSVSYVIEHVDSIKDLMKPTHDYQMNITNDTLDFEKYFRKGFDSALVDTSYDKDTSFLSFYSSVEYADTTAFRDNDNVDSVENAINRKLDSAQAVYNSRSDSLTRAYLDTMSKYSGIDSTGAAVNRLFASQQSGCPTECLDFSVDNPFHAGNGKVEIKFSRILCELKIFGNHTFLDFMSVILRLVTSLLSIMMIWSAVGKKDKSSGGVL